MAEPVEEEQVLESSQASSSRCEAKEASEGPWSGVLQILMQEAYDTDQFCSASAAGTFDATSKALTDSLNRCPSPKKDWGDILKKHGIEESSI
jgi:hypothetical protein